MRKLSDVMQMICRRVRLVSKRVTVSRDEPIICASSSCVKTLSITPDRESIPGGSLLNSSKSWANLARAVCGSSSDLARSVNWASSWLSNFITTATY